MTKKVARIFIDILFTIFITVKTIHSYGTAR